MALIAGALVVLAQLLMLPFDPKDHVPTSQSPQFQFAGVIFMAGFCALMLFLVGLNSWIAPKAGRLGTVAVSVAVVGTMLLGGDLWFETFAVPSIADGPAAHRVLGADPSALLAFGAISSYLLFAVGWALVGIAGWRGRVFPRVIAAGVVIGGLIGFRALLAPTAIPLAVAVAVVGAWMVHTSKARSRQGS
jgi:hypothetical protein